MLDRDVNLAGVILNRVAGARHERILRESILSGADLPVLGAAPKLPMAAFPQRHLGLLPRHEHPSAEAFIEQAAEMAARYLDIDAILDIARAAPKLNDEGADPWAGHATPDGAGLRIAVLRDSAFQFYYPENIEALARTGAEIIETSALESVTLPDVDALYIGGGFPETHADRLADNRPFRESLRDAAQKGLPVYAECGGLMYLSRRLVVDDASYPMVGALPFETELERDPQGHGYIRAEVTGENPFYPLGTVISGHEFHYSRVGGLGEESPPCAFSLAKGHGLDGARDGVTLNNVLATYVHVHALGEPLWAQGLVGAARAYRVRRGTS
jgi:cobyrinic acid a,c-diamide synthase